MSSASPKTPPSSAELAQLQQLFAADPLSEAYHPLAEAYLSMGRFMEAMVVCKKGVKAHPEKSAPHLLMARIYAEQGKDKKAIEELKAALGLDAVNVEALRHLATLSFKTGVNAEGTESLKKAIELNPLDEETIALCRKHKVSVPQPAAPAPAPMIDPPAPAPSPSPSPSPGHLQPAASQPPMPGQPASMPPQSGSKLVHQPQTSLTPRPDMPIGLAEAPTLTPRALRMRQNAAHAQQDYEALAARYADDDVDEFAAQSAKVGRNMVITLICLVAAVASVGGFFMYRQARAERETEIAKILKQMQEELSRDNYASYKRASELGERITQDLAPDLFSAHAFLTYAYAIRWGEHGEGDRAREPALEHLRMAKKAGQPHSYLSAGEAYIQFFQGKTDDAIRNLEQEISNQESRGQNSTLLLSTLGIIQTHAGRLESAIGNLRKAQMAAPADSRISAWMGNALRRQGGNDVLAASAYEQALRYEKNHAEAQLGVALMAVDAGKPETAEKYIEMLLKAEPPPSNRQLALARLAYAIILDGKDKKSDADAEEMKAMNADPLNGELYIMKANRQKRSGDAKGALDSIKRAIELEPTRTSFQIELADMLLGQPNGTGAQEAVSTLEKLVLQSPNSIKLLVLLGKAQMATKAFDKADETLKKAQQKAVKNEEKAEVFIELGNLAVFQKRMDDALKHYSAAEKMATSSKRFQAIAMTQKGLLYRENGDLANAQEYLANAQMADPNHAPPYFFLGWLLSSSKDAKNLEVAVEQLQTYLKLAPNGEHAARAKRLISVAGK